MSVQFIKNPYFAVVGASTSREKYGNRVLRWYQSNKLNVTPIHPKEQVIETIATKPSISQLSFPTQTSLSIITPPTVTLKVLEEANRLGFRDIWIQPGAEDDHVRLFAKSHPALNIILGGPCILVQGPQLLLQRK